MKSRGRTIAIGFLIAVLFLCAILSMPKILAWTLEWKAGYMSANAPFPVTVDPRRKLIAEDDAVNAYLADKHALFGAAVSAAGDSAWKAFAWIATAIGNAPWYEGIGSASGRFVTIAPGLRREQVAAAFADSLGWSKAQQRAFLSLKSGSALPLAEGSFAPGIYFAPLGTKPAEAQAMVNTRFSEDFLSHYGTSTAAIVPLRDALTIASLIQRETITNDGMRLLSGIMWNRIFAGMNLQVDATLQYAKAGNSASSGWWPQVLPKDKYIKSPYNTYAKPGLPPTPISNPGLAVLQAVADAPDTNYLYYISDKEGHNHFAATLQQHNINIAKYGL